MKKAILILTAAFISSLSLFAQDIPSKLLKGIETTKDEFTGETMFYAKNCCLSIVQKGDTSKLYISLSCSSYDTPVKLKKIYILTNGETTEVDGDFTLKEIPQRVMSSNSTGNFGTSSYKVAQFETRILYFEEWKVEATPYMTIVKSLIDNLGKVKFEGDNNTLFLEFSKKDAKRMKSIYELYEYLSSPHL